MSGQPPRIALAVVIAYGAFASAGAGAAAPPSGHNPAVAYRWVDEQGIIHYGDSVPPQYATKEQTLINRQGVVVRRMEAQKTPEQIAADARVQEGVVRQKQHDSFLLTTYTSVKDIEALRDLRLDQLKGQRVAAEQYVENLHSRLSALQTRARNFKPYSPRDDARRMPDDLAEDLVRTMNELHSQSNVLVTKGEEESTLRAQFQADIERYRELHANHVDR
jgi:Domain of unknown function (DUF4124)